MRAGWGALAAATVVVAGAALPAVGLRRPTPAAVKTAKAPKPAKTKATTPAAAPSPSAAPVNALKRWAATNGGGNAAQSATLAQALTDATNHSLILAQRKTFVPYVASMRQANPALKIVAYLNGTYAQSNQGTAYPDAWYAKDAKGAKVRSKKFGNYLMDPTNQGWIQSRSQTCADYVAQSGYDGCYLDMLGNATMGAGYVTAPPVNGAGAPWTRAAWVGATSKLAAAVQAAHPTLLVVGNGLANGNQYFDPASGPTSLLLNSLAGANAQGFIRAETDALTAFRPTKVWQRDVDMLADAGTRGRFVMAMTKVAKPGTAAQLQQVHRYALASFLLGTNGTQYFYFSPNGNDDGVNAPDTPDDHVNPGMPLGPYVAQASGAYVRSFSAGYAAVNPGTTTVTVNLGATYVDLDGHSVQQATLPPHTGMVFTVPPAPAPAPTTAAACVPPTTKAVPVSRRAASTRPCTPRRAP
jgi:hypothetical protein